jgi:hypothetical protein
MKAKSKSFGPWMYERQSLTLTHENGYEVALLECRTSAELLDWIFQVQQKPWADAETIQEFLRALQELLSPQENLCGGGMELGPIDVKKKLKG